MKHGNSTAVLIGGTNIKGRQGTIIQRSAAWQFEVCRDDPDNQIILLSSNYYGQILIKHISTLPQLSEYCT